MDKTFDVTDASFDKDLAKNDLLVVDCWAPWCGPCRMIAPILDSMAKDYAGKIAFGKLNVDDNQGVAAKHGIMSIPTLLVFKGGKLVDRITGAMPRQMLEPKIIKHLK
ncbi:MAG: thioredoxin [Candidatus Altiarchaeota archaeon]